MWTLLPIRSDSARNPNQHPARVINPKQLWGPNRARIPLAEVGPGRAVIARGARPLPGVVPKGEIGGRRAGDGARASAVAAGHRRAEGALLVAVAVLPCAADLAGRLAGLVLVGP